MKRYFLIGLIFLMSVMVYGQESKPDWRKLHYTSEEEMYDMTRGVKFTETSAPSGDYVRFPAEFEPMQAVTIRYPLGIPTNLVKQLSETTKVYCIVSSSQQSQANSTFQNAGCNMSNIVYYNMPTDSYWVRDYAPWYIFNDLEPAIVDNVYNRPRQNDDNVPVVMGQKLNLTVYGMNLTHTGGNMMEDGRGVGVSDELVLDENNNNENTVRQKMRDYLGIDPYHITIDPQGDYIAHVDCWGKLLAPDKILIAKLPQSNSQYDEYEEVANFFATTNCCWGYPYKVYRVNEPGGNTVAPYTNSLILNKKVFVPIGSNTSYNNAALQVYQDAMPGYEIIGITNNSSSTGWQNTDALHCRTRGVMDFDMLFIDHRNVKFGELAWQDSVAIVSKFIAYSGQALKTDSLLVYYSIDGGAYQTAHMTPTGNQYEYVGYIKGYHSYSEIDYYVFGADYSGHRYTQPVFAELEPHHFTMGYHEEIVEEGVLSCNPESLHITQAGTYYPFVIKNVGTANVTISQIFETGNNYLMVSPQTSLPVTLAPNGQITVNVAYSQSGKSIESFSTYISIVNDTEESNIQYPVTGEITIPDPVGLLSCNPESMHITQAGVFYPFVIKNVGEANVTISHIYEYGNNYLMVSPQTSLPVTLDPNGEMIVNVAYSQMDKSVESFSTNIRIINNSGNGNILYPVTGEIEFPDPVGLLACNPESLHITQAETSYPFVIKNVGTADVTISQIFETENDYLEVVPQTILPVTLVPNGEMTVNVTYTQADKGIESFSTYISIVNDTEESNIQYPVTGEITVPDPVGLLVLNPEFVTVSDANPTATFTIANEGSASVTISQIFETSTELLQISVDLPAILTPGQQISVTVTKNAITKDTTTNAYISIINDSDNDNIQYLVKVVESEVEEFGLLEINPESLLINHSEEEYSFVIKNVGSADVVISGIYETSSGEALVSVPGGMFSILSVSLPLPTTLSPNEELTVGVILYENECKCLKTEVIVELYLSIINDTEDGNIQYPVTIDYIPSGISETKNCTTIYPNPVTDFVHVTGKDITEVKVFDLTGRLVRQVLGESDDLEINMKDCESGVYIVQVVNKESSSVQPIVKK